MFSNRTGWALSPNRLTLAERELRAAGNQILDLTVSNPTAAGVVYESKIILDSLNNPAAMDYGPQPKGLFTARKAVADYYREDHALNIDPESIVLTTSTSEGYSYIFKLLCNPGDEILVPKPSYPLFEFLADLNDVKLVPYSLIYDHGWQIDFRSLADGAAEGTKAVVMVHPNNPTGSFVTTSERTAMNQFCRDRELALVVDEVFLDYSHDGNVKPSFASNDPVLTFTLSGLSKISGLPQMKLAWMVIGGPAEDVDHAIDRMEIIADTYLSLNAPVQLATETLLAQRKSIQPQLRGRIKTNLRELDRQLAINKNCERLEVDGGWYAVLRVPVTGTDEDLAVEILREASVLVHPGHLYDFPREGYMVLSLITPEEEFIEGMGRMLKLIG